MKISNILLSSILLFNSTGSVASLLLGSDLAGYSAVAGGALIVAANSAITDDLGAMGAIGIGANTNTENLYSSAAVSTGDGSSSANIYAAGAVGIAANASTVNLYSGAAVTLGANASTENIYSGAAVTLGALSSSQDVYAAAAITTGAGAINSSTSASFITAPVISAYKETLDLGKSIQQIAAAQASLSSLQHNFALDVNIGNTIFNPGVYKGTATTISAGSSIQFDGQGEENPLWVFNLSSALTVGALSNFEIINAGADASIIWNLGGALGLGAGTSFMGTAFITGAATGATSSVRCGNLFATAAIGIGSITSTNCIGSGTWSGSLSGFASDMDITNGLISNKSFSVPEPSNGLLMLSLGLLFFSVKFKRKQ